MLHSIDFSVETGSVYGVIDIWHLAPAGLLEQISLIVGYIWLIMIARHYRSTFATSPDRRLTDEGIDHDIGDAR